MPALTNKSTTPTDAKDNWCTPKWLLSEVTKVAPVGLDPCSNEHSLVPARVHYRLDRGQNGLSLDWSADVQPSEIVFVNPPYSRGCVAAWLEKGINEQSRGVSSIFLIPSDTGTDAFHYRARSAARLAFIHRRVRFVASGTTGRTPNYASLLVLFSEKPAIVEAFEKEMRFAGYFVVSGDKR